MAAGQDERGRKAGELNQHGCSMTGFAFQMMEMVGPDLSLVIFGERDCVSAFPRMTTDWSKNPQWDVYTVALREQDVVVGRAEERLEECLDAVAGVAKGEGAVTPGMMADLDAFADRRRRMEACRQPAIIVLSTCLAEVIGAVVEPVCRRVEARTGVRIIPVSTSGLRLRTQAEVVDQVAETLISGIGDFGPVDRNAVNLLGFQTDMANSRNATANPFRAEADSLIRSFGGRLNSAVPSDATADDWRNLPRGGLNFVVDTSLLGGVVKMLQGDGRRFIEVIQPKGVSASDQFYSTIARELGFDAAPVLEALPARQNAIAVMEEARRRFAGMRLAYGIGTIHNFRPDILSREGLGNLPMFLELGFDVEIVIQERDYPEVHQRIRRNLDALGVDAPYRLYYEPAVLEPALRDGRFDCAYVADFMRDQVMRAGIPMLRFGDINSGYGLAGRYVKQIIQTLGSVFDRRFSVYFGQGGANGEQRK